MLTLAKSNRQAAHSPIGVTSKKPHKLISAVMRLGLSAPTSFLPITAYAASQNTAPSSKKVPNILFLGVKLSSRPMESGVICSCFDSDTSVTPTTAQTTAAQVRRPIRSFRNVQLIKATAAGIVAITTPAATALVMLMPNSMQIENKKLPKNDSKNSKRLVWGVIGTSLAGFFSQCSIAAPPMPKRSQASRKTGRATTSGLDKAT